MTPPTAATPLPYRTLRSGLPTIASGRPAVRAGCADRLRSHTMPRLKATLSILAISAAALFIQTGSAGLSGNDSYYHVRMAELLPTIGFVKTFPWLHWTIFRDDFVSHHHGFHVILSPLVWLSNQMTGAPIWGGKGIAVLGAAATAWLVYLILGAVGVSHRPWWVLLLLILPWHFWLRQSFVRAPVVALPLLLGAALFMLKSRPLLIGLLGFVFTHVYGGVVLFPLVPLAFVAAAVLCREDVKRSLKCFAGACIGLAAGLVANPYFPANLGFLKTQVFETGLGASAEVGSEWKPFDAWFLLQMSAAVGVVWVAALIRRLRSGERLSVHALALTFLNFGFLILTIKARRFVEYWPVFCLLDAGSLATITGEQAVAAAWTPFRGRFKAAVCAIAAGAGLAVAAYHIGLTRASAAPGHNDAALADAMHYLKANSPAGSMVLTDDWDIFPACFYHNTHNHYAVGLDPVFTSARYPEIWERYRIITRGESPAPMRHRPRTGPDRATLADIDGQFEAAYVLVARDHAGLYHQLMGDGQKFKLAWPPQGDRGTAQPAYAVFKVMHPL